VAGPRGDRTMAMPILVNGTSGDDFINLTNDLRGSFEVWAGDGRDSVHGSAQSDLIYGGGGNDWLQGEGGDAGFHMPTPLINGGASDLAIVELDGVTANQLDASHSRGRHLLVFVSSGMLNPRA